MLLSLNFNNNLPLYVLEEGKGEVKSPSLLADRCLVQALKHLHLSCVGCLLALGVSLLLVLLQSPRAAAKLRPLHGINTWLEDPNSKSYSALGCQVWGKALPEKKKQLSPPPSPSLLGFFVKKDELPHAG